MAELTRRSMLGFLAPLTLVPVVGPHMLLSERPKIFTGCGTFEYESVIEYARFEVEIFEGKVVGMREVWRNPQWTSPNFSRNVV